MNYKDKYKYLIFGLIILVGGFLRLYKSDWGDGVFFHPDEYHIVSAVERLQLPHNANPEMFSYGSFTVYLIYFTKVLLSTIVEFEHLPSVFIIGRTLSGIFSTATLLVIFLISNKLFKHSQHALWTTFLVAITPGLIQQAHFTTPESFMIFWIFLCIYFSLLWTDKKQNFFIFASAVCLGIATGTKITALLVFPTLLLTLLPIKKISVKYFVNSLATTLFLATTVLLSFLFVFPFSLLDKQNFLSSINYESAVGRGTLIVFYTRQFINTVPVVFQFQKVYPFALGLGLTVFGTAGFVLLLAKTIFKKKIFKKNTISHEVIILVPFIFLFIGNAFLHVKWTRFVAPTFPFFSIFSVYLFTIMKDRIKKCANLYILLLVVLTIVWSRMFFSIYLKPDVRSMSDNWMVNNIKTGSVILTESGNTYEVPLSGSIIKIPFDFYNLEGNSIHQSKLINNILDADYFIVQSRRVYANSTRLESIYPFTANYYNQLFNGNLGFEKIVTFTSYPGLQIMGFDWEIDDENAEETWSVFDHPVITVYEKTIQLNRSYYEKILQP